MVEVLFGDPQTPLFTREYDAIGFWGHVQDVDRNLWSRFQSIFTPGADGNAIFDAAGANTDEFLSTWASSEVNRKVGGPAWHITSAIRVPAGNGFTEQQIRYKSANPSTSVSTAAFTTVGFTLNASSGAPLVHIMIRGHARLSEVHDYTNLSDAWFCIANKPGLCTCPKGESGHLLRGFPLEPGASLTLTGDPGTGTAATVQYAKLSVFCRTTYGVPETTRDLSRRPEKFRRGPGMKRTI
jgi:hypothetical protein